MFSENDCDILTSVTTGFSPLRVFRLVNMRPAAMLHATYLKTKLFYHISGLGGLANRPWPRVFTRRRMTFRSRPRSLQFESRADELRDLAPRVVGHVHVHHARGASVLLVPRRGDQPLALGRREEVDAYLLGDDSALPVVSQRGEREVCEGEDPPPSLRPARSGAARPAPGS